MLAYFRSGDGDRDECYPLFVHLYEKQMDLNRLQKQPPTQGEIEPEISLDIMEDVKLAFKVPIIDPTDYIANILKTINS